MTFSTTTIEPDRGALLKENARLRAQVARMSIDSVTGIPNRGALDMELQARQSRQMRGEEFAIMFVDIDHFKKVNDTHGHAEGDRILSHVASVARSAIRPHDFIGRYGGEEFVIITDEEAAVQMAERVRMLVQHETQVTVSIGVSFWGTGEISFKSVLNAADTVLYAAKEAGRNNVKVATGPPATQ